jgi:CPA2 family monovalent cation:H+ antiporter-2
VIFAMIDWLTERLEAQPVAASATAAAPNSFPITGLTNHSILVGFGRVGSIIAGALQQRETPFVVIETSDSILAKLRERGIDAITGNAAGPDVLNSVNASGARNLVIAIPEAFEAGQIVKQARAVNPAIQIVARAHSDAEVEHLTRLGADIVIMGEREIARAMTEALESAHLGGAKDPREVA